MLQKSLYHLGQMTAKLYTQTRLETNVIWHAPLPDGPKIIAANHPTTSDPIWLMAMFPEKLHFIVTYSLGQVPAMRWYLNHAGHLIQDKHGRCSTFGRAVQCLRTGDNVAIFPEGGLTPPDNTPARARTGTVRMALATGAPIIPVGISVLNEHITFQSHNFGDHQKQARWYLTGPYAITVGAPIYPEGHIDDQERAVALSTALVEHIFDLSKEGSARLGTASTYETQHLAL